MSITFEKLLDDLLNDEGGYSYHKSDSGGETMFGITSKVARKNKYAGPMSRLPLAVAQAIYKKEYWINPGFDKVFEVNPMIAGKLFNAGVNIGHGRISIYLQKALNAFNGQQKYYDDVMLDGKVGFKTVKALRSFINFRGVASSSVLLKALNCLQGEYYIYISQKSSKNEDFAYGWIKNRIT